MLILPAVIKLTYTNFAEKAHPLKTTASLSACIIDAKTKKVIWSRDKDTARYPASTTKIMTCLLMLENMKPDDIITAPSDVTKVRESSMNLKPGEKVRVKNMAYALMLRSANDGCYAVAVQMDGSVPAFAKRMNERAKELGCENTHFANPNGLNNKDHKISAYDLCLVTREALKRSDFQDVVRTQKKLIDRSINYKDRLMISRNKYLWKDPSADGVKTGWTIPAGHTYVGSATRNGTQFITGILNSPKWMDDHKRMLDYAFATYETKLIYPAGPYIDTNLPCEAELKDDVYACVHKDRDNVETNFVKAEHSGRFKKGDILGHLVVVDRDKFTQRIPVYAKSDEPGLSLLPAGTVSGSGTAGFAIIAIVGTVGAGTLIYRGIIRAQSRA